MRQVRSALGALILVLALAAPASAAAHTSGNETFKGVIITSGASGSRVVLSSVVVARGVFTGVGRIVEVDNQPGDPDNAARDDLVFADGSIHIISFAGDVSISVNQRSCIVSGTVQQTGSVLGGTGRFAGATGSFSGAVTVRGLASRNPDGSCNLEKPALLEVDATSSTGTLSF